MGLLADVRAEERRGALAAFLTLFGVLAAHTLLETARDALFLARLPPSQLPWAYLAIAALAVAFTQAPLRLPRRLTNAHALALLLVVSAAVTFAFWGLGSWRSAWALRGLYVWTGLFGTLALVQLWLVLGDLYTLSQAKRLYKLIGIGSVLGAVAGAGLGRELAARVDTAQLLLAAALVLAATAAGPAVALWRLAPAAGGRSRGPSLRQSLALLPRQPYVRSVAGLVLASSVALTLADYIFKASAARYVAAAELGVFFASVYLVLNLLALLVQLFAVGWLLRALGLQRALLVLPALVALGATAVAFGGGLLAALLLKGADGSLRHSLHRTSSELLFLPLSDALRARAKPLIDAVGQRGGQALASVLILADAALQRGDAFLAGAAAAVSLGWLALAIDLRGHYLDLFRTALREGALRDRFDLAELDLGSLETLIAALNSADDAEVVGALDVLAAGGRLRLIPALILFHPSRSVVLRALELLADSGRADFVPVADRLLSHADAEVRAAALRARTAARAEETPLRAAAQDGDPLVRATALAGLVSNGWIADEAQATLDGLLRDASDAARLALATAIARQPVAAFGDTLERLADDRRDEVRAQAAQAMAALPLERFLAPLLRLLTGHESRGAARAGFVAQGDAGLRFLERALVDPALPQEIRRHVPRAIAEFPPQAAAEVLQRHLIEVGEGLVRFRLLRALGRIASRNSQVTLDPAILREAASRTLESAFRVLHWRSVLETGRRHDASRATRGYELLVALLADKERQAVERLFRLLSLVHRDEDLERIYHGLRSRDAKVRATSNELLENTLEAPLREAVLAIVDDAAAELRLARAAPFYRARPLDYEGLLAVMLDHEGETLRSIAAYHVGELGLRRFRGRLQAFEPTTTTFFLARVVERALRLLDEPPAGGVAHAG